MGTPDYWLSSKFVDTVKSWLRIPRRSEPPNVSNFWMPDQSCKVCYECDSQFTVFNRRHHCRLCGWIFCAKCTANSVPAPSNQPRTGWEDWERIRVCNYCLKQWQQEISTVDSGTNVPSPGLSPSPSAASLASAKSSCTSNHSSSTVGSTPYSTGPYHRVNYNSCLSPRPAARMNAPSVEQNNESSGRSTGPSAAVLGSSPNYFALCANSIGVRSDEDDYEYGAYHSDSETRHYSQAEDYGAVMNIDAIDLNYGSNKVQLDGDSIDGETLSGSSLPKNFNSQDANGIKKLEGVDKRDDGDNHDASASVYEVGCADTEPVDFENNGLLWLPPEPEDEEDDREAFLFDEEDDDASGEWGYLHSNSFGSGECCSRDKSIEEHKRAMKNVVEGHFRALVAQLLHVENLPLGDEDGGESWLDIVTSLSWEAATLLKPDTSRGGVMDPGGYVKVKCVACGHRSESTVVKGVVCKKNVAHRRMTSKIDKPRFLILGGALEYQRVANHLSSFDTLLQQEMDHLKMAIAKIDAHHPNVLLVEKSVARHAQEYLLEKDISLVLNIKRPLLERIARCIGAQIVPSIDYLTSQKLGYCDAFHMDKFFEEHGSAGQDGKKLTKTLMFFEGCPKPLGFTILLKGDNGDELKKVKHVVQYAVFAAYHLALETSFLADEGASLPDLPLKSPITIALPDKPSSVDRCISTVPGFANPSAGKPMASQLISEPQKSNNSLLSDRASSSNSEPTYKLERTSSTYSSKGPISQTSCMESTSSSIGAIASFNSLASLGESISFYNNEPFRNYASREDNAVGPKEPVEDKGASSAESLINDKLISDCWHLSHVSEQGFLGNQANGNMLAANRLPSPELESSKHDANNTNEETGASKEEFPPSSSDHQSILVSLSTRCVWKGSVCERAHIFRIKYYGNFDKPLGRFLQDHLFDESYHCYSCNMPSEAHVHCYTHQQGSLTISVKKLPGLHLPGERECKIWMWHRCLQCPRINGFPPATRRVVMSDAAWGLSFGKFLELSFSNHAAASRVASCGHSLHRDCLRFYGFGRMVACFRYASIDVHSVYLPPPKLEFNYDTQEWIRKEADEVKSRAAILFNKVQNALQKISEKISGSRLPDIRMNIEELEGMLQKDKAELQESFQKAVYKEAKAGQPSIDILEINKLHRQMLFHSYVWDQCLVEHASSLTNNNRQEVIGSYEPKLGLNPAGSVEKLAEMNVSPKPDKASNNCDPMETKPNMSLNHKGNSEDGIELGENHKEGNMDQDMDRPSHSPNVTSGDKSEPLESGKVVQSAISEGEFPVVENLSETLEAAWTGGNQPASISAKENVYYFPDSTLTDPSTVVNTVAVNLDLGVHKIDQGGPGVACSSHCASPTKKPENVENSMNVARLPTPNSYSSFGKISSLNAQKLVVGNYSPSYVLSFRELEMLSGARLLLPVAANDTVVHVYDDEPTSIIAYALVLSDYHVQMSKSERARDASDSAVSLSLNSFDETLSDSYTSSGSGEENISRTSQGTDPLSHMKDLHARVSFTDDGSLGKVKYTVTCYHAKRFESLRRTCCPSELDFIRSLSRCKKWGAQGGKSNVFFAKTLDDRFIIKEVTKTELESFIKFGPAYFNHLSESISTGNPTCLAKILGIYQVSSKHLKGGKESKVEVLVMENLLFRRIVTRLYDLKGSSRSRYNPDTSGSNKVLLDQNLIEAMPTSPIFVGSKAKRLLERAVWNDTSFLASVDVMDYSLLVGVDEEKHELVLGIIDFMRQYTWDKHVETWVKTSGILGGAKNTSPTVISPQKYKKRFRKAMTAYFVMVPDQWTPTTIVPSGSQTDLCEENTQTGTSFE